MEWDIAQLRALSAAVSEGTFEAAARVLHVTPSAISQRLRALEVATGRVLLVRSKPVQVTESGEVVLRLARQIDLLAAETAHELGEDYSAAAPRAMPRAVPIAVNADSLATWVLPALALLAGSVCLDIHREDQEYTARLLREGTVMAAITADADPVPGCSATRLGSMRYRPMAGPAFIERWLPDGSTRQALAEAPVVVFDRKDDLQHRYLRGRRWKRMDPPKHFVPSSADFLTAVRLGLGWGMLPDLQSAPWEHTGQLIDIDPHGGTDVALYWQQWKLRSATLDRIAVTVLAAARRHLRQ